MKKMACCLIVLLILFSGCAKQPEDPQEETTAEQYRTYKTERVTVGIEIGEEGYYSTWAGAEITYEGDEVIDIVISDPVLLAFRASERWPGGYYIRSAEDVQSIVDKLEDLRGLIPDEKLDEIIDAVQDGGLMDEAST